MDQADALISESLGLGGGTPKQLPEWLVWVVAAAGSFGLSLSILLVPGNWRRLILWVSALVVMAGWAPVLVLASREPVVAIPLLATFWSGLCAFVYASRHHMAVDD
jgi:hypothetical protein